MRPGKAYPSDISREWFEPIRPLLESVIRKRTKPRRVDLYEVEKCRRLCGYYSGDRQQALSNDDAQSAGSSLGRTVDFDLDPGREPKREQSHDPPVA